MAKHLDREMTRVSSDRDPRRDLALAIEAASDKKAENIVALNLRGVATFTDYFLICSGTSTRQVQAIAEAILEKLEEHGVRPLHVEGETVAQWILIDYGDLVVHVFEQSARDYYDLERLWRDAEKIPVP
jgi:ribosome-associated protein